MNATPLRDLLTQAMQRARVSKQVTAAQIVSLANEKLDTLLSPAQRTDARVVFYREHALTIEVNNASIGQYIKELEGQLLHAMHERLAPSTIRKVNYRVVHHFRTSEH